MTYLLLMGSDLLVRDAAIIAPVRGLVKANAYAACHYDGMVS